MKDVSFENILKLSFNNSLLDTLLLFYVLFFFFFFAKLVSKVMKLFSFYSDLDYCGQRLKTVSNCQNFDPLLPTASIYNLQLNSQSKSRKEQQWRRRWTTLERVRLLTFGWTSNGLLTAPSDLRGSLHVDAAPARVGKGRCR